MLLSDNFIYGMPNLFVQELSILEEELNHWDRRKLAGLHNKLLRKNQIKFDRYL